MTTGLRLKHVAKVDAGQSPPSPDVVPFDGKGMPFLQGNAEFGSQYPTAVHRCDSAPRIADSGALLVSVRAPVGAVNTADQRYGIGRGLAAVSPRAIHARYAYWLLLNSAGWLNSIATGSTFTAISGGDLGDVSVPVTNEREQRAIADYLDRETAQIDAFIAKNEELIALLTERRAAIVSRRVAQGLNPDAPMAETVVDGLGLVPAHWKVERFARVAKIRGGLLDPSDSRFESWALIAPNHIRSASGELLELVPASEQSAESGKYPVKKGDVVYSKIRPALAKAVIAPEDCLCSADMYGITSRSSDVLDNRYLRWQMLSKWFTEWATERSMRVAMPKVNQDTLSAAPIIVPPIQEQRDIVERIEAEVEAVDAAVGVARRSVELARERRAALISAAVTGKIDVGVAG
ncbi:restriction endonuclease subunit S [Microbacterium aurum]